MHIFLLFKEADFRGMITLAFPDNFPIGRPTFPRSHGAAESNSTIKGRQTFSVLIFVIVNTMSIKFLMKIQYYLTFYYYQKLNIANIVLIDYINNSALVNIPVVCGLSRDRLLDQLPPIHLTYRQ